MNLWQTARFQKAEAEFDRLAVEHGPWKNIYSGSPNLAGVMVNQFAEGLHVDFSTYIGKHPVSIYYVFWNGDTRMIFFKQDGSVIEDLPGKGEMKPDDWRWSIVDYSYGSDPTFKHHKDPRLATTQGKGAGFAPR